MTMKRTSFILITLIAFSVVFSLGCMSTKENSTVNTLIIGEMWDIETIDPVEDGTLICEKAAVTETLVGANPDFSLKPSLAKSWEQLDENTWEFILRDDVRFHDGTIMTAEDVKFSLERSLNKNSRVNSMLRIASINVIDDYTICIETSQLNPILPGVLHYPDTSIIKNTSIDKTGKFVKPIGTGPYKFESFNEQTGVLTVIKNEQWWGGDVGLDKMILKGMSDPNTRAMAIENGELDFTVDVPYSETTRIDELEGINVEKYQTPRVYKIDINLDHQPLDDIRVRQAISYAINRDDIVQHVLYDVGKPAIGPFLPSMVWTNKSLRPYEQNIEIANQLLDEAGLMDTNDDGIREKDGKPLKVSLITYAARPGLPPMAEAIAAQLKQVGINLQTQVLDIGAIDDMREKGNWDLYLAAYNIAMVPDPEYVLTNWYTTTGPDNGPGYSNANVDVLIEEARTITDLSERYKKFNKVESIIHDEQPMIMVAYYGCAIVKKDVIRDYVFDPTAHDYRINADMYFEN
jgi:peptide/nickel transport system substrate-binding protein